MVDWFVFNGTYITNRLYCANVVSNMSFNSIGKQQPWLAGTRLCPFWTLMELRMR